MKKIWGWVKDHWVPVVCCALIVIALPLAFFFSQRWGSAVHSKQEKAAGDLLTKLTSASKVNYAVPSVVPGVPALEQTAEPNEQRTAFFKAQKDAIVGAASGVLSSAEKFNRRNHTLIMEDIFPDPERGQDIDSLTLDFAERIVGRVSPTGVVVRPSVYQKLFDSINAGPPADPVRLATMLEDRRLREIEKIKGPDTGRTLTKEEEAQLAKALVDARLAEYQRRARELSVYASMDSLPSTADAREGSWVPRTMPTSPPKVWECFAWQFDYWVIDDLLAAVGRANTGPDGRLTDVERSVVKRVEKIKLDDAGFYEKEGITQARRGGGDEEPAAAEVVASETDEVKPDFKESLTGRTAAPVNKANGVYDIRRAEMTVIVSSARLPQLLSAISSTNFMTVLDCDMTEVSVWGDLAQGYYYGNEHVTRATLTIETVWLRSLTKPLMPHDVRVQLNIADEQKSEGEKPAGEGEGKGPA
ncbi:MAG: hypothetical protein IT436_16165 [Phycisphaerales bacterium]|nr:hypothetical protein [Phycisphaerales bacterium]